MIALTDLYTWFHNYYRRFYSSDPKIMHLVQLKEDHSIRVAKNSRELAESLGLSGEKAELAEIIGLLHDIARSEQAHLKTFNDAATFDHGDRGVLRLKEAGILDTFDKESREMILFAIQYHNKMTFPLDTPDKMLFARMIKDADKLDIFRLLPPIIADHNYSPILVKLLQEGKVLPYPEVKTEADKKLVRLGWLYDVNYKWTLSQLLNEEYGEEILGSLPDTSPFDTIKNHFREYSERKLAAEE